MDKTSWLLTQSRRLFLTTSSRVSLQKMDGIYTFKTSLNSMRSDATFDEKMVFALIDSIFVEKRMKEIEGIIDREYKKEAEAFLKKIKELSKEILTVKSNAKYKAQKKKIQELERQLINKQDEIDILNGLLNINGGKDKELEDEILIEPEETIEDYPDEEGEEEGGEGEGEPEPEPEPEKKQLKKESVESINNWWFVTITMINKLLRLYMSANDTVKIIMSKDEYKRGTDAEFKVVFERMTKNIVRCETLFTTLILNPDFGETMNHVFKFIKDKRGYKEPKVIEGDYTEFMSILTDIDGVKKIIDRDTDQKTAKTINRYLNMLKTELSKNFKGVDTSLENDIETLNSHIETVDEQIEEEKEEDDGDEDEKDEFGETLDLVKRFLFERQSGIGLELIDNDFFTEGTDKDGNMRVYTIVNLVTLNTFIKKIHLIDSNTLKSFKTVYSLYIKRIDTFYIDEYADIIKTKLHTKLKKYHEQVNVLLDNHGKKDDNAKYLLRLLIALGLLFDYTLAVSYAEKKQPGRGDNKDYLKLVQDNWKRQMTVPESTVSTIQTYFRKQTPKKEKYVGYISRFITEDYLDDPTIDNLFKLPSILDKRNDW